MKPGYKLQNIQPEQWTELNNTVGLQLEETFPYIDNNTSGNNENLEIIKFKTHELIEKQYKAIFSTIKNSLKNFKPENLFTLIFFNILKSKQK